MPLRSNFMIGTAGHVDHGKTSLVKMLTGCETDTLREEKERGMSIDLGFAPCQLPDQRIIGIVDVPGHEKFIRNMVAGATGIDIVLLVVAADDGVMPQTVEHLDVLMLLGVRHGVVALTKIDMVSQEQIELAIMDAKDLLAGTPLENAPVCPVSNVTLDGLGNLFDTLSAVANQVEPRPVDGIFRLAAERAFSMEGFGTVATGIPCSGRVQVGDTLEAFDLRGRSTRTRVRHLEVYGHESQEGLSGQCVAVNLADVTSSDVGRGCVLATPEYVRPIECLEVTLELVRRSDIRALKSHSEVHFHTGTMVTMGQAVFLDETRELAPGASTIAQVRLKDALIVARGDRFIIRGADVRGGLRVIGGGRVINTSGTRLKARPEVVEGLRRWEAAMGNSAALLAEAVREAPQGITPVAAARSALLPMDTATELGKQHVNGRIFLQTATGRWLHRDRVKEMADQLCERLAAFHKEHPQHVGPTADDVRKELDWPGEVFEIVVGPGSAGRLVRQEKWLRLATHKVSVSDGDSALLKKVEIALRDGDRNPPQPAELAQKLGLSEKEVRDVLVRLTQQSVAVKVEGELWFHRDIIVKAAEGVRRMFAERKNFTTMDFRDMLGTSRKYAVPMLDYFDALAITRRVGNTRYPGAKLATGSGPVPPAKG